MNNLLDLIKLTDDYISYLKTKNVEFDCNGIPVFSKEMFLKELPELIVPFDHRNNKIIKNKSKTVLCTFTKDIRIYPRLRKLFEEINFYKEYSGVVTSDLTLTSDMDNEWQEFIILLNQLYGSILAVNGVKLVLNTRIASTNNLDLLKNIPKNIICSSSFLGCKYIDKYDYSYLAKILKLFPSTLLIYGKVDENVNLMLDNMGIDYKYYNDFHKLSKEVI